MKLAITINEIVWDIFCTIWIVAITFFAVRYYDYQQYKKDTNLSQEKYEKKIATLEEKLNVQISQEMLLRESISEPVLYEAVAPKESSLEIKNEN